MELLRGCAHNQTQKRRLDRIAQLVPSGHSPSTPPRAHRQPHHRLKPEQIAELADGYRRGVFINDLAKCFGIHRATVIDHLKRAGVPLRRGLVERRIEEAIAFYNSGLSVARIGEHMGVDDGTVWLALRRHGVRMRDTHGRQR